MTTHVALLRAVNLPGHNKASMAELRALLAGLGFADPQSLLQSGNLVFRSDGRETRRLESMIEGAAKRRLGLETDFFLRTAGEWRAIIAANPFVEEAKRDPSHLVLMVLREAPTARQVAALQEAIRGREAVRATGRQAYIVYPDGIGRSRLTMALIERKLGTRGTGRNWNTVLKLGALAMSTRPRRPSPPTATHRSPSP
jgi:uncharacterized protein (DUF1697 family)